MKKLIFIAAIVALASCSEDTRTKMKGDIPQSEVPATVVAAFTARYPAAADVEWEKKTEDGKLVYETEFKLNGHDMDVFWDENGAFLREEKD